MTRWPMPSGYQPACVIDIATLTGAIVVALGHTGERRDGKRDALVEDVRAAGERAGERVWPLPLWDEYREIDEVGHRRREERRWAAGGKYLGRLVSPRVRRRFPWAHLDIAGTAYTDRDEPIRVKGPTGIGVRLFTGCPGQEVRKKRERRTEKGEQEERWRKRGSSPWGESVRVSTRAALRSASARFSVLWFSVLCFTHRPSPFSLPRSPRPDPRRHSPA